MKKPTDEKIEERLERAMNEGTGSVPGDSLEEAPKAQMLLTKRLIGEIEDLRKSLDKYRFWSRRLTITLILLSFSLLIVAILQLL